MMGAHTSTAVAGKQTGEAPAARSSWVQKSRRVSSSFLLGERREAINARSSNKCWPKENFLPVFNLDMGVGEWWWWLSGGWY